MDSALTQFISSSWALILSTLICAFVGIFFVDLNGDSMENIMDSKILFLILGIAVVTYLSRVMAALIFPKVLTVDTSRWEIDIVGRLVIVFLLWRKLPTMVNYRVDFALYCIVQRVWVLPKIEKRRSGRQPGAPFFRCVATPDVLAKQQVTPVWQVPFFCKCTYTCCACCSLKSQSCARLSENLARTRTLFSFGILTRTPVPDILKTIK